MTGTTTTPIYTTTGFTPGTAILTTDGEVLVEHLLPGDTLILATGVRRQIAFIAARTVDLARHPSPAAIRPVRIMQGALGDALPTLDLTLAPDHALLIGDTLVQAKDLIDGASIIQDFAAPATDYYQIELAAPGMILAHGATAESGADAEAPICAGGAKLAAIRARLHARHHKAGLFAIETVALTGAVAGRELRPTRNTDREAAFTLPEGATSLVIQTPVFTPAAFDPASTDRRSLGIAIAELLIDGRPASLEAHAASGMHRRHPADRHPWTTGMLRLKLPAGTREVALRIAARPKYWRYEGRAA